MINDIVVKQDSKAPIFCHVGVKTVLSFPGSPDKARLSFCTLEFIPSASTDHEQGKISL